MPISIREGLLPMLLPDHFHAKAGYILWLLMALIMPWGQLQSFRYTAILAILLMVNAILGTPFTTSWARIKAGKNWLLPWAVLYGLQVFWLIGTINPSEGGYYISTRLGLLWVPLVLILRPMSLAQWRHVAWIFALSVLAVFLAMNREGIVWLQDCPICYIEVVAALGRPYLAPYMVGSAVLLGYSHWPTASKPTDLTSKAAIGLALFLLLASLVTYAKMSVIGLLMGVVITIGIAFVGQRTSIKWASYLAFTVAASWLLITIAIPLLLRDVGVIDVSGIGPSTPTSSQPFWIIESFRTRLQIWQVVGQSLAEGTWLFGVGTGGVQQALHPYYCLVGIGYCQFQYNPHNQFLEFWVQSGLFGLAAVFYWMTQMGRISIRGQHYGLLFWLLYLAFCLSTECMINREAGVLLIGLISSGLYGLYIAKHTANEPSV